MAFTKINAAGIGTTETVTVDGLTVINNGSFGGNLSVGGTITYEDVTNVDSVGIITARAGVLVGSGITLSKDGDIFATGITTVSGNVKVGTGITLSPDGDVFFTGIATGNGSGLTALNASNISSGTVPTARLGSGTASSSTFLRGDSTFAAVTSTTINSNADNRVITGSGTADTLNAESKLTFDGTGLLHLNNSTGSSEAILKIESESGQDAMLFIDTSDGSGANADVRFARDGSTKGRISFLNAGSGQGDMRFTTGSDSEAMRIDSSGRLLINKTTNRNKYFNGTYTGQLQVEGTDDSTRLTQLVHNSNSASQHIFVLGKSRGGVGDYTVVQDGDFLGTISFQGADGDEMVDGARIEAQVNGTPGNDAMPTDLIFKTNTGSSSPSERLRITEAGDVSIGGMAPDSNVALHIERTSGEANFLLEGDQSTVGGYLMLKNKNNTANSSMAIQFLDASGQGVSEISGVAMSDANNQGYLALKTRPNGGSMTERFRVSDIGVIEKTQQSNVRTFEFAFSGGVGGSTTTQAIATLSNTAGSTMAIAHIDYVSTYGVANDYIHCGIWACSTRRKNSNTGWQAESNQVANGGSGSAGPVVCGWLNGELQFTCTAFMGYTIHVQLTVYNALTTINAL